MPTTVKAVRIQLKHGTLDTARKWAQEINARRAEAMESLQDEGVAIEAAFLDQVGDTHYLVYVMKGDLDKARSVARHSQKPIDLYHQKFKQECWQSIVDMEPLLWLETAPEDALAGEKA